MMRSLYSAVSGLRNHQTRMDVIANNIANVNTVGYKTSRVVFQDIFSQTSRNASSSTGIIGGTNPIQIGLGITLSAIDVIQTESAFARTDRPLDFMIEGEGLFIIQTPTETLYTRAGNFYIDDQNYLVNSSGYFVKGYPNEDIADALQSDANVGLELPTDVTSVNDLGNIRLSYTGENDEQIRYMNISIDQNGKITGKRFVTVETKPAVGIEGEAGYSPPEYEVSEFVDTLGYLFLATFNNTSGLEKAGESLYRVSNNSGLATPSLPNFGGAGKVKGGGLEMSNVDLANEMTDMIVTQRGFQANSRAITVSDTMLEELINLKR
ncbi:MAG: flagellar hook-basal body complex protein [Firmicutes bacterium]|nr:flagellar hook-basal body complex protein [Bacillota bacterium]